jgi:hypothetical protein
VSVLRLLVAVLAARALSGCVTAGSTRHAVIIAQRATAPMTIDGNLDEPIWQTTPAQQLQAAPDVTKEIRRLEGADVRLAWDVENLYIAVEMEDSDLVAEGQADQLHHYKLGDVVEVFLKPDDQTWYWELHATPTGKRATLFVPGRGRVALANMLPRSSFTAAAQRRGTLNDWRDSDQGWSVELAIPWQALKPPGIESQTAEGAPTGWTVLVARYNYTRYSYAPQLSETPRLSKSDFHTTREYAQLRCQP